MYTMSGLRQIVLVALIYTTVVSASSRSRDDQCKDRVPNCVIWSQAACTAINWRSWTQVNCKNFCGFCSDNTTISTPTTAQHVLANATVSPHVRTTKAMVTIPPKDNNTTISTPTTAQHVSANATVSTHVRTTKAMVTIPPKDNNTTTSTPTTIHHVSANATVSTHVRTTKAMVTIPPKDIKCVICAGPPEACELAYYETTCHPPNHYCINHVTTKTSGQRLVERRCGNIHDCYNDWYLGTSDDDKCRQLSSDNILTYNFECSFCCIKDGCNVDLHPKRGTLYMNV